MAKYQQYAEYKDSGVEWLGEIPTKWKVTALKRYCNVKGGYAFASDTFSNAGEPVIRIGDIKADGSISLEGCKFISTELAKSSHAYLVEKGQLLMAMTGATIGKAGVYINDRPAYLNQRVGKFVIDNDEMNYSFLWYTLKTNGYQEYIKLTAFGGAQPNISDTGMVDYISCFPSLSEQTQIANFLDYETAQIDTLIEKQQTLIQLLKEKRQAVISHAVTKGLNLDAPMKDSGVEWLGEVPEHWDVTKFNYEIFFQEGPGILAVDFYEKGIPLLRIQNVKSEFVSDEYKTYLSPSKVNAKWDHYRVEKGDLIISCSASTGLVSEVDEKTVGAIPYTGLIRLKPLRNTITVPFIKLLVQSELFFRQIENLQTGSTIQHFGPSHLSQMYIPLPPKHEQENIDKYVTDELAKLDALVMKAEDATELMQERRTALISAAVTGKIDVRGWVAPE